MYKLILKEILLWYFGIFIKFLECVFNKNSGNKCKIFVLLLRELLIL